MKVLLAILVCLFAIPSHAADFLVMKVDKCTDESVCYQKGDIVEVFPDGRLQPQPPNVPFVLIRVPGFQFNSIYHREWREKVGFEIVASNEQGFRIRAYCEEVSVSGLGALTLDKIENFLTKYGAIVRSASHNEIVFDVSRDNALELQTEIRERLDNLVRRRMYNVPDSVVANAVANNGVATYTVEQAVGYLKRKMDE